MVSARLRLLLGRKMTRSTQINAEDGGDQDNHDTVVGIAVV